ncbi:MAG: guanylate kinase [Clostridia bacterium]|nr:guanylate kinase [Clostridia bacterium]
MKNVLVVLSGPSGVGKGTVAKIISEKFNMALSVSCTTRAPREGEINGKDYIFIDKPTFLKKIDEDGFLEYSEHFENLYGTPKCFVEEQLKEKDVFLEIDVEGGLSVKKNFPEAVLIMMMPPSREELLKRLVGRNTETEEAVKIRMKRIDYEIELGKNYDYTVINDKLDDAVNEVSEIILKEKQKNK